MKRIKHYSSEGEYKTDLIEKIEQQYPTAIVMKNDAGYIQGIPDLIVTVGGRCAYLETKKSEHEKHQPNQDYYVDFINETGGFARFIYPENEEEILDEMEYALQA